MLSGSLKKQQLPKMTEKFLNKNEVVGGGATKSRKSVRTSAGCSYTPDFTRHSSNWNSELVLCSEEREPQRRLALCARAACAGEMGRMVAEGTRKVRWGQP
jgi:hypothetical protein